MSRGIGWVAPTFVAWVASVAAADLPDIGGVPVDLTVPHLTADSPAPGRRVKQVPSQYRDTQIYHVLYLPTDWAPGRKYPVIVEYAGNGGYRNRFGDTCGGRPDGCSLGYGISGGHGMIWICLPYVSEDHQRCQERWWGDIRATVEYCLAAVAQTCREYGGDESAVFLAGFSRGSIACNYVGLHDDRIARLWRGFICHSHYDGVRRWNYPADDRASAAERLARLGNRPQFISHEGSVEETQSYLNNAMPDGRFTFIALPYRNHTDAWVLRDIAERKALRGWLAGVLRTPHGP